HRAIGARVYRRVDSRACAAVLYLGDRMADRWHGLGDDRLLRFALAGSVRGHQLSDMGPSAPGSHEHDGLRLGVDGRDGNGRLVDGKIVPNDVAISIIARRWRRILEPGRVDRSWRNPARR